MVRYHESVEAREKERENVTRLPGSNTGGRIGPTTEIRKAGYKPNFSCLDGGGRRGKVGRYVVFLTSQLGRGLH